MTIYDIDAQISACIDECGEIIDTERFDELQIERDTKLENVACWYKNLLADAEAIKSEVNVLKEREARVLPLKELRAHFLKRIEEIGYVALNGDPDNTLPGTVNVGFQFVESEGILTSLDINGIAASSGSACASDSLEPSHVLLAMGIPHADAQGAVRFSFGKDNTTAEIDLCIGLLKDIIAKRREMSPLFAEFKEERKLI